MARKDTVVSQVVTNQSMAASFTSPVTVVRNLDNCSYQINFTTSDAVGSFVVEGSNDYKNNVPGDQILNAGNWIALDLGGTPVAASANDQILIDMNQLPFNAIRFRYVRTSGTGTLNAFISCKQIGG